MTAPWDSGLWDPMLDIAEAIARRNEARLLELNADIDAILEQQEELWSVEPDDEEQYWEDWIALRCHLVEREYEWAVAAVWLAWARAYLDVRPLDVW